MTAPHAIGAGNARDEVEFSADVEGISGQSMLSDQLIDDQAALAERLAELDFALTGTACYGLTWPERLERIVVLRATAEQFERAVASLIVTAEQRG